jgi:hypothetical protein
MRDCVEGPAEPPPRHFKHARPARLRDFSGAVAGAVDDQNLDARAAFRDAFATPRDEAADGEFLVEGRHKDRHLGIGDAVSRDQHVNSVG